MELGKTVETDPERVLQAFGKLRLQTQNGNDEFRERFRTHAAEHGVEKLGNLLKGLSPSNVKNMRRAEKGPHALPGLLVSFLFIDIDIDVTLQQTLTAFDGLGFDIQLALDIQTLNMEDSAHDAHDLKNFRFEIYEAKATAEDPETDDFELDLRIGFDRTRLTIRADRLRPVGNYLAAETPATPGDEAEADYSGWFLMRLATREPLSWVFDPLIEGQILDGRVDAEVLGRVETVRGAALVAEITARRDALKVRIVDEDGGRRASKSLSDQHRDKMCAAVARKSFAGAAEEFLIHRLSLIRDKSSVLAGWDRETQCL